MQFSVYCAVTGADEIASKVVDTPGMNARVILFCERWIWAQGGVKGDPNTGTQIGMTVIARNDSAILLNFEIEGHVSASMFAVSGIVPALDQAIVQQFVQNCANAGWAFPAAASTVPVPGLCLIADPQHGDVADAPGILQALMDISDSFAAAFFNQLLMPV